MDEFLGSAGMQMSEPRAERQITRPRLDQSLSDDHPFRELTIRDLIVELGKVEDAQAHRLDGQLHNYSERYLTRREKQLLAELPRRRTL